METKDYLRILVEDIHSTVVATIGKNGHPVTRCIDISDPSHVTRGTFTIGNTKVRKAGYFVGEGCIGCGSCLSECPQIIKSRISNGI